MNNSFLLPRTPGPQKNKSGRKKYFLTLGVMVGSLFVWMLLREIPKPIPPSLADLRKPATPTKHSIPAIKSTESKPPPNLENRLLANNIVMTNSVLEKLHVFAKKPVVSVPIDSSKTEKVKRTMRSWVSRTIDLNKTKRRESARFSRVSYFAEVNQQRTLYLDDRIAGNGSFSGRGDAEIQNSKEPTKVIYREGKDGEYYKFQKLKENERPSEHGMDQGIALEKAKAFFVENQLVYETGQDKVHSDEVRKRTTEGPIEGTDMRSELLEQEDVVLRRMYDGKPVINSVATVGVLPEGNEVVGIKLSNWNAVDTKGTVVTQPAKNEAQSQEKVKEIQAKLVNEILKPSDGQINGATVLNVQEGWFQRTNEGLMPVLIFNVELTDPKNGTVRPDVVVVNPEGDNSVIWQQGKAAKLNPSIPDLPQ